MPKYTVTVTEAVTVTYDPVEIEAVDEQDAIAQAEEMRVQGDLGTPTEAVDDVAFDYPENYSERE